MQRRLFAACLLGALALGAAASAQTAGDTPVGKQAGTVMLRGRVIGVIPQDSSSNTSIGGHISTTAAPAPEVDLSLFFTDNIAGELIAASTQHTLHAIGTTAGNVNVGSSWVLPPTVTLQYHFMPHERFSPYVGAGMNVSFFYASSGKGPTVTGLSLDDNVGAVVQAGFDYNISGHWFANFDVKQIFVNTTAHLSTVLGPVTAHTALNPLVVGAGIGYRF